MNELFGTPQVVKIVNIVKNIQFTIVLQFSVKKILLENCSKKKILKVYFMNVLRINVNYRLFTLISSDHSHKYFARTVF